MKKLFYMLVILFLLYLGIQFCFTLFSKGNENEYVITDGNRDFNVYENSYFIGNKNTYSFVLKADNTFNFQIDYDYNKLSQVLIDIKYYKDNIYECILPIFRNNLILMDMMCYSDNRFSYYYSLKGNNKNLDNFVLQLDDYNISQFTSASKMEGIEGVNVYKDNLIKDHYIGVNNYRGIFDISDNFNSIVYNISLYNKHVDNPILSAYVDQYFISADYDKDVSFTKFNIVNLVKLRTDEIMYDDLISFNSYVQGVVDGKVYIYDKDNQIQYEINVANKTIVPYTGNIIKYYKNGSWTTMSLEDANKEVKFTYNINDLVDNNYERIDKIGDEVGYYYLYKRNGNVYDVYRRDIQNKEALIYLFSTKSIDNIYYLDDYVYFTNGSKIQVYNNLFGVRNLVDYTALNTNNNFKINVYSK